MTDDLDEATLIGRAEQPAAGGDGLMLTENAERGMATGEEIFVRLPSVEGSAGWTYELEGDFRALDVFERAAVVTTGGAGISTLGISGATQFLIHAERKGKAVVRFEPLDETAGVAPLRLRIKVG